MLENPIEPINTRADQKSDRLEDALKRQFVERKYGIEWCMLLTQHQHAIYVDELIQFRACQIQTPQHFVCALFLR